jgi:hypothetical protein
MPTARNLALELRQPALMQLLTTSEERCGRPHSSSKMPAARPLLRRRPVRCCFDPLSQKI